MDTEREVLTAEDSFFAALSRSDRLALGDVVADDCVLVDVLTGSEVPRATFVGLVGSRRLRFESIERLGARVRLYAGMAVVTGRTRMSGRFGDHEFRVHSRYTHVYVRGRDGFRLVNAQGTPVATAAVPL